MFGPKSKGLCKPCKELDHDECEGADSCSCTLCRELVPLIKDLESGWAWDERIRHFPD